MKKLLILFLALLLLLFMTGCGLTGSAGTDGRDGEDAELSVTTGTIYNSNYTSANPSYVSIRLPGANSNHAVLFVGIENSNGVYEYQDWSSTIYGFGAEYTVGGQSGYYVLIYDSWKSLLTKNYQVKYIK
ncbi:hypothetical protein ACFL57_05425 [Candidatus Margulisiibacteriota bacterium]